ncbi:hypothetical protein PoB_000955400 [Plakobranchus ocellatus]|uniref:Uncharacterized protein n=1 Tax=Plakobranchus ocellatus TaxID=259542 RepID=A0AAV3YLW8_9GAST|nr:hypothetical protein PoB_000955400 [Plakobranchus ocellatus]
MERLSVLINQMIVPVIISTLVSPWYPQSGTRAGVTLIRVGRSPSVSSDSSSTTPAPRRTSLSVDSGEPGNLSSTAAAANGSRHQSREVVENVSTVV